MALRLVFFFSVTSLIWAAGHYYVGRRFFPADRVVARKRRRGWAALIALGLLGSLTAVGGRLFSEAAWFHPVRWAGFIYMGLFSLVFFMVVARDVLGLPRWLAGKLSGGAAKGSGAEVGGAPDEPAALERRHFLANATSASMLGASGLISGWGLFEATRIPEVVEVDVPIDGLPACFEGYRIAQLSDVHIGPTIKGDYLRAVVAKVNGLGPDLVAVTGDLVDGTVGELAADVAPLADLRSVDGTYFVTGNHEYYWDAEAWLAHVAGPLGITTLTNEHRLVEREGGKLLVAGCTDYRADRHLEAHASDPGAALRGAPAHDVSILLAHQPRSVYAARDAGFDLQLSGHTHGGQFFPLMLFVGLAHPFVKGLSRLDDTWIYVNRGTGYWGPPLRAGVPSEITLLRLTAAV